MTRKLFLSIADQAVVSAFNFALNVYLIKCWTPEDFGVFTIVSAASLFAAMLQNALINTPLAIHLPVARDAREGALLCRTFAAANLLLGLLVLASSLAGFSFFLGAAQLPLILCACLYIGSQLLREYFRGLLAVRGRLGELLLADAIFIVLAATSLVALHLHGIAEGKAIYLVLLVLGAAGILGMIRQMALEEWPALRSLPDEMRMVFKRQIHEIRWSLLGAVTTDVLNRGYVYVAAAAFGPATVAQLQAARIFFGPLGLVTLAWSRVARPQLAALIGCGDTLRFNAVLSRALWAFAAFNVLLLLGLWTVWPYLSATLFGSKYQGLGVLVAGWGVANLVIQMRSCLGIGVQAVRRFRPLTLATIGGALVSVLILALVCAFDQPRWLPASVICGECMAILLVVRILHRPAARVDDCIPEVSFR